MLIRYLVFCAFLFMPLSIGNAADILINKSPVVLTSQSVISQTKGGAVIGHFSVDEAKMDHFFVTAIDKEGRISGQTSVSMPEIKPLHAKLAEAEENIILLLHFKAGTGQKYIYRFMSRDGGKTFAEPLLLNTTADVLAPTDLVVSGSNVYAVWIDELRQGRHDIYLNYSNNSGQTFQKADTNVSEGFSAVGAYALLAAGDSLHVFFTGAGNDRPVGLYYRATKDGGKSWTEAVMVTQYAPDWQPHSIKAVRLNDGSLRVFWIGRGLHTALSNDGINWKQGEVVSAGDEEHAWNFDILMHDQTLYAAMDMGNSQYNFTKVKPSVYIIRSDDGGGTWTKPEEIRRHNYRSTSALGPVLLSLGDKNFLSLLWRDHRNIRGGIYMNYSADNGKTWQEKDIAVEDEQGRHNSFNPSAVLSNNNIYVIWHRAKDDARDKYDLYLKVLNIEKVMGNR